MVKKKSNKKTKKQDVYDFESCCLEDIHRLESLGVHLQALEPLDDESDAVLSKLEDLMLPSEYRMIKESGAFTNVKCEVNLAPGTSLPHEFPGSAPTSQSAPPVPVESHLEDINSDSLISDFLKHLETILEPQEQRQLVAQMLYSLHNNEPLTHLDLSDSVVAAVFPSLAQFTSLKLDAEYKYTTAQFLQVYLNLRHVILGLKTMLWGAEVDALLLHLSGHPKTKFEYSMESHPSAVVNLRALEITQRSLDGGIPEYKKLEGIPEKIRQEMIDSFTRLAFNKAKYDAADMMLG